MASTKKMLAIIVITPWYYYPYFQEETDRDNKEQTFRPRARYIRGVVTMLKCGRM